MKPSAESINTEKEWIEWLIHGFPFQNLGHSLHFSRIQWVKSFPKASTILDLGGTAKNFSPGALIALGYPYSFNKLFILDLPIEERHELYQEITSPFFEPIIGSVN